MTKTLALGLGIIGIAMIVSCQNNEPVLHEVSTTPTGYQYIIERDVPGTPCQVGQYALVHVVLSHGDSILTDTRVNPGRPNAVQITADNKGLVGLTKPIQDILKLMSVGDSARLFFPVDSFPTMTPALKDFDEITYALSVVDVLKDDDAYTEYATPEEKGKRARREATAEPEAQAAQKMKAFYEAYARGQKDSEWTTTDSGLKYVILEKGGTGKKAAKGDFVSSNYYGVFADSGKMFDNSYRHGRIINFAVGKGGVIKGWDEGLQLMEKGDKAVFLIPSALAYGSEGYPNLVPPNKDLLFYIELIDIGVME